MSEEKTEKQALLIPCVVVGTCRFRPTPRHKARKKGDYLSVPEDVFKQYEGTILERLPDEDTGQA